MKERRSEESEEGISKITSVRPPASLSIQRSYELKTFASSEFFVSSSDTASLRVASKFSN